MFNYLRSNCDIGCRIVWSEVLLCIKKDPYGFFYKDFHGRYVIYVCATSFMLLLKSHAPKVVIIVTKYMGFPVKLGYY